jgi:phage terminase large subunit-like protein
VSSAGSEAVELAAQAGLILDPWEVAALTDALGERADGKWAAKQVGVIVPRQNGKGAILEARELAGLFLFGDRLIVHTAHEFKTATEAFRRIRELIEQTPEFDRRVFKMLQNNNDMSIETMSRQRLRFVARSGGSGRGFTGDCVILDEAYELPAETIAALVPTLSARPNPQVWITSSAPKQTIGSEELRKFCRRGRKGSESVAYIEYSADPDCDPSDPRSWAEANPNLGVRITEEWIRDVEVGLLGDQFARERLGLWDDTERSGDPVIAEADWSACRDEKSGPVGPVCFALDVSPSRTFAAFAVAGSAGRGGPHVEVVDYRPGTDWLVARAKELHGKWGGQLAVASGSPAASLLVELEAANVPVLEVSTSEHAQACARFFDATVQHALRHLGQFELDRAVDGAERKFFGDSWLWARRQSSVDISPLVACTLALWAYEQAPPPSAGFVDLADFEG